MKLILDILLDEGVTIDGANAIREELTNYINKEYEEDVTSVYASINSLDEPKQMRLHFDDV